MTYANLVTLDLAAADTTPVTTAQTGWATTFPAHIVVANQIKDESCAAYVAVIRPLVRRLQASLGIAVAQTSGPIGPPTTSPIVTIECDNRLQQLLLFVDSATPTKMASPRARWAWKSGTRSAPPSEGRARAVGGNRRGRSWQ